ncbi:hypothetical protein [Paraburkholderia tropica]|uniref:hypothetical protein n=1 Tax=Paraburkholderia tropica TaxID=92647 RepID=UPI000F553A0D|nr:hypothetical protein [Paraburkholderia tropica]RQN37358.1 hypothetical protein EHZ25_18515 [Paraburkholderia tropica]
MATKKSAGGSAWDMMSKIRSIRAEERSAASKSTTPARHRGASGTTVGGRGINKPPKKGKS